MDLESFHLSVTWAGFALLLLLLLALCLQA